MFFQQLLKSVGFKFGVLRWLAVAAGSVRGACPKDIEC